jgi:hypothetical protein
MDLHPLKQKQLSRSGALVVRYRLLGWVAEEKLLDPGWRGPLFFFIGKYLISVLLLVSKDYRTWASSITRFFNRSNVFIWLTQGVSFISFLGLIHSVLLFSTRCYHLVL